MRVEKSWKMCIVWSGTVERAGYPLFSMPTEVTRVPNRPKRPCSHPGCPRLTNSRFCDEHAKQEAQRYERYQRDPGMKKRYGRAWQRVRERFIAAHPLCERCKDRGKTTPAQEVHHIVPLSQGGTHDETNLMSLCTSCHSEITAREGCRWG